MKNYPKEIYVQLVESPLGCNMRKFDTACDFEGSVKYVRDDGAETHGLSDDALDDLQDRGVISHPAPADGLLPEKKALWKLYIAADEMRRTIRGSKDLNPHVWVVESVEQQLEKWAKDIEDAFDYVREDRAQPQAVAGGDFNKLCDGAIECVKENFKKLGGDIIPCGASIRIALAYAVSKNRIPQPEAAKVALDMDNAREVFENWLTAGGNYPHLKHKSFGGQYLHEEAAMKWDGFKAGYYALQTPASDEDYQRLIRAQSDLEHSRVFARDLSRQLEESNRELSRAKLEIVRHKKTALKQSTAKDTP